MDGDGDADLLIGAPYDNTVAPSAGVAYLVLMPRTGDVELLASADAVLWGTEANGKVGIDVFAAGDGDADGLPDLWVSAAEEQAGAGVLYLVSGTVRGAADIPDIALATLSGENPGDRAGTGLVTADDLDGDGSPEVVVGASGSDRNGADAGAVYVMRQPTSGSANLGSAGAIIVGDAAGDLLGSSLEGLGDMDGDGLVDLAVHGQGDSDGALEAGALAIASPPTSGEVAIADIAKLEIIGEGESDSAGAHVAACDVDGDAIGDLLLSAHEATDVEELYDAGKVYLFYGPLPSGVVSVSTADATFLGAEARSKVGQDVGCADFDGDGFDDIVIGAEAEDTDPGGDTAGAVYILNGRPR